MRACWQVPYASWVRSGGSAVVPMKLPDQVTLFVGMHNAQAMGWARVWR